MLQRQASDASSAQSMRGPPAGLQIFASLNTALPNLGRSASKKPELGPLRPVRPIRMHGPFKTTGSPMCGIVAITAQRNVVNSLIAGLKALEYRGYDSAGVSVIQDGRMQRQRMPGKVAGLEKR